MAGTDILTDALNYALDKTGGAVAPVAVINATGFEDNSYLKQSGNACNKLSNTLNGVFNTILIRSTRQLTETLGLLAMAVGHAGPDGRIYIAQENAHGAGGLEKQIARGFKDIHTLVKFKCRILVLKAADADPDTVVRWAGAAAIQKIKHNRGEFWSAPGVFSWDRPDPGSVMLMGLLPKTMHGVIADLGCGNGLLTGALARKDGATAVYAIDADYNAVESCKLNLADRMGVIPVHVFWGDATAPLTDWPVMDYVVMNPPFHTQQAEDRQLGQKFCNSAMKLLRSGGELYLVANRHMPYEDILAKEASNVTVLADTDGFKILKATKK